MPELNLKGLSLGELEEFAVSLGERSYRGKQLFDWIYSKEISDFRRMTTISTALRERLSTLASIDSITPRGEQHSAGDGTTKYLFELGDGRRIESVLIPPRTAFRDDEAGSEEEQKRLTLCVSTQVGCPLDCSFCATASMGFLRNLTAGEIVDQLLAVKRLSGRKITNIVFMGMGEPLMNYDGVMKSADIISTGMGITARRITVSTAGWVPGILRMAAENRRLKLAVSLHTMKDDLRRELMPVSKKYPLASLTEAVAEYCRKTKQRVTFEYILFDGLNDTPDDVRALASLTKRVPSKVNIIPYHDIGFARQGESGRRLRPTPRVRIEEFAHNLRKLHATVFVRGSAGEEIHAACGQLAVKHTAAGRIRSKSEPPPLPAS